MIYVFVTLAGTKLCEIIRQREKNAPRAMGGTGECVRAGRTGRKWETDNGYNEGRGISGRKKEQRDTKNVMKTQ